MGELTVGSTFADHVVRAIAGRGAMGVVYRAMHLPLKREVALKVITPERSADDDLRERFHREIEAAASIQHVNVVPIYHAGEEDGLLYVTMRYVEGTDLGRLLAARKRLEPRWAVGVGADLGEALDAAHARGIVHRDVKPSNVLLEGDDATHAMLTDFGLMTTIDAGGKLTQGGLFVGTLDYAAPEQIAGGRIDARTDVYSLGCLLFHALTGRIPYPAESEAAKMFAHVNAPPPAMAPLAPGIPHELDEVVRRAMAKDPRSRYPSAGELGRAALAVLDRSEPGTRRTVAPAQPARGAEGSAATLDDTAIPLPPAVLGEIAHRPPFVGRADALSRLTRRYALAKAGQRQFVLVCGEPGIGKTRLATELGRQAHDDGATVLYGRCDAESLVPYQPFITAVQHRVAHRKQIRFPEELAPELGELGRFIPALRPHAPVRDAIPEEVETHRLRLFQAVTRVMAFAARSQPAVLILEDLHWADASTTLLLSHLLQDPEPVKLLVLGTFREAGECRCEEFLELVSRMRRQPGFERISLTGLDRAETRALVTAHADLDISEAFVQRLREATDGNPFFIEETLRSLDLGEDVDAGGLERALSEIAVPEEVKEMIARRLAGLSDTANQVLTVASVVGREFRLEVLETLLDEPAERLIDALEDAADAGLVREVEDDVDRFLFSHALVRETLYEEQSASRRVRLHHRIGEALEVTGARFGTNPAELAHHFFASRHLDRAGKAETYAVQAAEHAARSLAYEEALAHYRRALDALENRAVPDARRVCEVLLGLGWVESRAGSPAARQTFARAADMARRDGAPEQLAQAALGFAGLYAEAGIVDPEAIELLEEALEALGPQESRLVVKLLARLADRLQFAAEESRTLLLSGRALEMAERIKDREAGVTALESRHGALLHIEHVDERLRLSQEVISRAAQIGGRELEALGHHWRIYDLLEAADIETARGEHRALVELAEALRQPLYRHFALGWDVVWAQMDGRVSDAERLARQAYDLGKAAQARDADTIYAAQLVSLRRREGRLSEYIETVESFVEQHPALVTWRAVLPLAHLAAGNVDEGVAGFERFAQDDFRGVPRDMFWFAAVCVLAETCALLGDTPRARTLYAMIVPYRERNVQVTQAASWGSAERFLGLLATATGDWDLARDHFESALAKNASAGIRPVIPLIRRDYAEMLLARGAPGDRERAVGLLHEALGAAKAAHLSHLAAMLRARIAEIDAPGSLAPPRH